MSNSIYEVTKAVWLPFIQERMRTSGMYLPCPNCYGPCTCPEPPAPIETLRSIPVADTWEPPTPSDEGQDRRYWPVALPATCPYTHAMYEGWTCRLSEGHSEEHDLVDTGRLY